MKERTTKIYFEDIITFIKRIESYIHISTLRVLKKINW